MRQTLSRLRAKRSSEAGLTLLELILTIAILLILSSAAVPMAQVTVKRDKEIELRRDLREMRNAIDRYKDAADRNLIRVEVGTQGYPPDLQTLVKGVTITAGGNSALGPLGAAPSQTGQSGTEVASKVRFLRKIPVDPMTGRATWGLRGVEDAPDSTTWSGHDVFDVYSLSTGTALDGTKYSDW